MKPLTALTVAFALPCAAATAGTVSHTFDLVGTEVDGTYTDNFGITSLSHDFGSAGAITNIEFTFKYDALDPSWASEFAFSIDTDSGFVDVLASDYGAQSAPGTFVFSDSLDVNISTADGVVLLTLWDSFQDDSVFPDVYIGFPSSVTLTFIPGPGALVALGSGLVLAAPRRRA